MQRKFKTGSLIIRENSEQNLKKDMTHLCWSYEFWIYERSL